MSKSMDLGFFKKNVVEKDILKYENRLLKGEAMKCLSFCHIYHFDNSQMISLKVAKPPLFTLLCPPISEISEVTAERSQMGL